MVMNLLYILTRCKYGIVTLTDIGNPGLNFFGMPMNDTVFDFLTKFELLANFFNFTLVYFSMNIAWISRWQPMHFEL